MNNKAIKYGVNCALIGGFGSALINGISQSKSGNNEPFRWDECLAAFLKGALAGGAVGFIAGTVRDYEMDEMLTALGGLGAAVDCALESCSEDSTDIERKAAWIQNKLYKKFKESLIEFPCLRGSIARGTAIVGSDGDIQLKFHRSIGTIAQMRDVVEAYLKHDFADRQLVEVRIQEYSIGLFFKIRGEIRRFDIVPMRAIDDKGNAFIYSGVSKTIRKTNAQKQSQALKLTEKQRKIIKLLKGWKKANDIKLPSILIEHLVVRAFAEEQIPRGLDKAMLAVVEYIARKILTIRVVDPANSNNVISEALSISDREKVSSFCYKMLDQIERDHRNILDYFQIESEFMN